MNIGTYVTHPYHGKGQILKLYDDDIAFVEFEHYSAKVELVNLTVGEES